MAVRAKFRVDGIDLRQGSVKTENGYESITLPTVRLSAVTGHEAGATPEDAAENTSFWDATPQGQCSLTITNGGAAEFFELGKSYYLDFSKA
jgi:hypothetical protein